MKNEFNIFLNPIYNYSTYTSHLSSNKQKYNDLLKITKNIEGLFIQMIVKSMRNSFPHENLLSNESESVYQDIYDNTLSQAISKKGFNFSKIIAQKILKDTNLK
ncbi:rod-binding protein [Buchnera aphidicola (Formosaphis micheliae)]|uniref:rod-binding protein n=1 Tax=Buchnera aphidicola TaxID=9 RepID=UPI0031B8677A